MPTFTVLVNHTDHEAHALLARNVEWISENFDVILVESICYKKTNTEILQLEESVIEFEESLRY